MTSTTRRRLEALERHAEASMAGLHLVVMRPDMSMTEMKEQACEAALAGTAGRHVLVLEVVRSDGEGHPAPRPVMH